MSVVVQNILICSPIGRSYFVEDRLRLFQNDGSGVFQEVACEAQIGLERQQRGLISLDVDNDGDLDLIVGNDFEVSDAYYLGDGAGGLHQVHRQDELVPHTTRSTCLFSTSPSPRDS